MSESITNRQRFRDASRCREVDRPPVWIMRQAGRALPEYRALKEKYTFVEMVSNPELATEVTLQPIRRFDFDAAIIFSDILVIPEAMGQPYAYVDGKGIKMQPLQGSSDIDGLDESAVMERLDYVPQALRMVARELDGKTALIGFAGSPWTLANFMLEGGGAAEYTAAKRLFYTNRELFDRLMGKLTRAISVYLQMQIDAGVDALQIFDSHGGLMSGNAFEAATSRWIGEIIRSLKGDVPVIVFSRGTHGNWKELVDCGANVVGLDWTVRLSDVRDQLPENVGVQGNLDPMILTTTPEIVERETKLLLADMRGRRGHIFNLGHGLPPLTPLENIQTMVDTIRRS